MATLRRLLLVAFLFFCIFSSTASARSLRETSRHVDEKAQSPNSASNNDHKVQRQAGEQFNGDDLVTMDYTPAKKNPPIHN
ncbi:hypothetical protein QN277_006437 [Acacia crassicarpa]|uniref:Uncharacterized protein n=1 Tax=Acacia crassicarpa TaxID=499986 RepID=A0AAE1ISQ3_9FABA|nr:hypothetical protein QN277_006437 [Acacia crassicarpa]